MTSKFQLIKDVERHSTNWTVQVMVMEKSLPKTTSKNGRVYQRLVLQDVEV